MIAALRLLAVVLFAVALGIAIAILRFFEKGDDDETD